jgi:hypothetical protein
MQIVPNVGSGVCDWYACDFIQNGCVSGEFLKRTMDSMLTICLPNSARPRSRKLLLLTLLLVGRCLL